MPLWVEAGYHEYAKRIRGRARLDLIEIPAIKRGKNADIKRIIQAEEMKIVNAIPDDARTIALDRRGKSWSSRGLSSKLQEWMDCGDSIALVIGGPEGLSDNFIKTADEIWSLSALTFAHPLVRVVLAEQLYRCLSILEGSPYHR
jgi:23S rRNA (pseudouridine1915-N3)-methyltransferase